VGKNFVFQNSRIDNDGIGLNVNAHLLFHRLTHGGVKSLFLACACAGGLLNSSAVSDIEKENYNE